MASGDFVTEGQVDGLSAEVVAAVNTVRSWIGVLANLDTTDKSNVVNAINEALAALSGGGITNLTFSRDGTTVTVLSDTGSDAVLPAATTSLAGVLSAADKTRLDGIETAADVTDAANVGAAIHGASTKASVISGDKIAIIDTETGNVLKSTTVANLTTVIAGVISDSAPAALDTLNELAAALGDDANFATTMSTALGLRVRVDASQSFTAPQQAQGRANLGIGTSTQDFAGDFNAAIV